LLCTRICATLGCNCHAHRKKNKTTFPSLILLHRQKSAQAFRNTVSTMHREFHRRIIHVHVTKKATRRMQTVPRKNVLYL